MSHPKYKPQIDGLRAIAILPVIFYHAQFKAFGGGFVGVDIFFVISGYLITTLIMDENKTGVFSFLDFYERRIRRIFPALYVVFAASFLFFSLSMPPDDFLKFAKSILYQIFFVSNTLFSHEGGYFSNQDANIPMLHTWSLSVEEQFYVFFPILILSVSRFFSAKYARVFIAVAIFSLMLSIIEVYTLPKVAFYIVFGRAWELLAGALIALDPQPLLSGARARAGAVLGGLALIAFAIFGYSATTPFPGLAAVLPVAGTAIILDCFKINDAAWSRIFATKPLVGIGRISYPLYLWHWPILVFAQMVAIHPPGTLFKLELLGLAVVLSMLTVEGVERPIRTRRLLSSRRAMMMAATATAIGMAMICALAISTGGLPQRFNRAVQAKLLANARVKAAWAYPKRCQANYRVNIAGKDALVTCSTPGKTAGPILFWGDSTIEQLYPLMLASAGERPNVTFVTSGGCPPIIGVNLFDGRFHCDQFNAAALQLALESSVKTVVLGSRRYSDHELCDAAAQCEAFANSPAFYAKLRQNYSKELAQLKNAGKKVVIILPGPQYPQSVPDDLDRSLILGRSAGINLTRTAVLQETREFSGAIRAAASLTGALVIDPSIDLCPDNLCLYESDGISFYIDGLHLSPAGTNLVKSTIEAAIR